VNNNAHTEETTEQLMHRCLDHITINGIGFAPLPQIERFVWQVSVYFNHLISNGDIFYHKNVAQKEIRNILWKGDFSKRLQHLHEKAQEEVHQVAQQKVAAHIVVNSNLRSMVTTPSVKSPYPCNTNTGKVQWNTPSVPVNFSKPLYNGTTINEEHLGATIEDTDTEETCGTTRPAVQQTAQQEVSSHIYSDTWRMLTAPNFKQPYFWNIETNEVQWEPPVISRTQND